MLSNFVTINPPDTIEQPHVPLLKSTIETLKGACLRALLLLLAGSALQAAAQSKIAFVSNRDGNNEIYVMNADGTGQIRLTNKAGDDCYEV